MIPIRFLFSILLIIGGGSLLLSSVTFAYISDEDRIDGSISTGTFWEQSDDITFDITGARLTGGHGSQGVHLHKIFLINGGDEPVGITGMIVGWDPCDGEMLQQVHICGAPGDGGDYFWTGTTGVGSSVKGEYLLSPSDPGNLHCWFDSDMSGKTISLTFIFDDGSQKGVSVLV